MKKLLLTLVIVTFLVGGASGQLVENYTGWQLVTEGEDYNFGFDFWYLNSVFGVGTDAPGMSLNLDAVGPMLPYSSGYLGIDFYSTDPEGEYATLQLTAWNSAGGTGDFFGLGIFDISSSSFTGGVTNFHYDLTAPQLDAFDVWGWGNVNIKASITSLPGHDNDFVLEKVEMGVSPIPEPSTLLLLGSSLIGVGIIGWFRRRRK